jgi:hypothetical protein
MRFEHEGISLWYGTPDAPAPEGVIEIGSDIAITIGVHPTDASNKVDLLYCINQGPIETVAAKWLMHDLSSNAQYFRVSFPALRAGDTVEYTVICRCAGRQVPSPNDAEDFTSSFRVIETETVPTPVLAPNETIMREHTVVTGSSVNTSLAGSMIPSQAASLWTQNLVMVGLGTQGDRPPHQIQPPLGEPLRDGIHLRWSFRRELGFPWYGYYLFRRRHRAQDHRCFSHMIRRLQLVPGTLNSSILNTSEGTLISDRPLTLVDQFPPLGIVEFDLAHRHYLRYVFPSNEPACEVQVTIGFREDGEGDRRCIDFSDRDDLQEPAFSIDNVAFKIADHQGNPWRGRIIDEIGGQRGLNVGFETHITLPCPASQVSITLLHAARPATVIAMDEHGTVVDETQMSRSSETLILRGQSMITVVVRAPANEAILSQVCYSCTHEGTAAEIEVSGRLGNTPVVRKFIRGQPGQVITERLSFDTITAIQFSSGNASVIDICATPLTWGISHGWEKVPNFPYPLCLPVAHADYPCVTKPTAQALAEEMAVERVRYGNPDDWRGTPFQELHDLLQLLVENGPPPAGEPMANRVKKDVPGIPIVPGATTNPVMPEQYPLDLILVGSLNPAIAQMVSLYWVDEAADPGISYDYLILADYTDILGGDAQTALTWVTNHPDFSQVDGYIVSNKRVEPAPPLDSPTDLRVYALPGSTRLTNAGHLVDATNNAGLLWDLGKVGDIVQPEKPVLYHLWRASLGSAQPQPDVPPSSSQYDVITRAQPILVVGPTLPSAVPPTFPADWPRFRFHTIDSGLAEGWYSYLVSGIDLFGRHSSTSAPAHWFQWSPMPHPRPWYYQDPPGDTMLHPYAVGLLDKIAPPPPSGIEAYALDPQDPTLLRDAAYKAWQDTLTPAERTRLIGLRVSWQWTPRQMQQAPDAKEFRIYLQPGQWNMLVGRSTGVTPASSTESIVETDIPNTHPVDTFIGTSLRMRGKAFQVVGSQAGSPLHLRVKNIGPTDTIQPPANASCTIVIPEGHTLYIDYATAKNWEQRYHVVDFNDSAAMTIAANGNRRCEVFLPTTGGNSIPLSPTLGEPIVYANIGVSTADDKTHTPDNPKWNAGNWGGRTGNEGRVGGPITIYRVRRECPPTPAIPTFDSDRVYATPADYHSRSYYTYRWVPLPNVRTHIFRALDDAVFQADWRWRKLRINYDQTSPFVLSPDDEQYFPVEFRGSDPVQRRRRELVARALNDLNTLDLQASLEDVRVKYGALANEPNGDDALRVLAGLPGSVPAFTQLTIQPLDQDEPDPEDPTKLRWRNRRGPDDPEDFVVGDPHNPLADAALCIYIDTLDGRSNSRYFYRTVYVDGAHNQSATLSISSPPVYLPKVTPPRAPVITKVQSGDREITLSWASNREPDLAEYRVYRAASAEATRDLRLMNLVGTVAVDRDPTVRPATVQWSDKPLPGLKDFWYCVVTVGRMNPTDPAAGGGNVSEPSVARRARAACLTPPPAPTWVSSTWGVFLGVRGIMLSWSGTDEDAKFVLRRRRAGTTLWTSLAENIEFDTAVQNIEYVDVTASPHETYEYMLLAVDPGGNRSGESALLSMSPPQP